MFHYIYHFGRDKIVYEKAVDVNESSRIFSVIVTTVISTTVSAMMSRTIVSRTLVVETPDGVSESGRMDGTKHFSSKEGQLAACSSHLQISWKHWSSSAKVATKMQYSIDIVSLFIRKATKNRVLFGDCKILFECTGANSS